jgi:RNA polymerase sigma-70 factor (ECF subfamily)
MTDVAEDRVLVRRARAGDYSAFNVLVTRHERRVYGLAMRIVKRPHDAEEVVQQTFLSVVEHLEGFREESSFSTWLLRIATNHALLLLRRRSSHATVPLTEDHAEEGSGGLPRPNYIAQWRETPEQIASRHETRQILTEALDRLDARYSIVFVLRDLEGFSTRETAETLGISVSNVKVRLLRARLMLRESLTKQFGDEATRVPPHAL